jgi:hypothetical protein
MHSRVDYRVAGNGTVGPTVLYSVPLELEHKNSTHRPNRTKRAKHTKTRVVEDREKARLTVSFGAYRYSAAFTPTVVPLSEAGWTRPTSGLHVGSYTGMLPQCPHSFCRRNPEPR